MRSKAVIGAALALCFIVGTPAAAIDYTFVGDGTAWTEPTAWSPNGVPTLGDTAQIGDGTNPITCIALGNFADKPDSITVKNNAIVDVQSDIHVVPDGTYALIDMTVESGGVVKPHAGENGYNLNLLDGSELLSDYWGVLADTRQTFTISSTARFTRDITPDGTANVNESRYDATITGPGNVEVYVEHYDNPTKDRIKFRRAVTYTGSTTVLQGRLTFGETDSVPTLSSSYTVHPGAELEAAINKLNHDGDLYLLGTGAGAGHLVFRGNSDDYDCVLTVHGAMFGGVPVPAGTYTVGTDYTDYLVLYPAITDSGTLHVLTTIPEPATLSVLALGALALVTRRR
jgi:hypothetical protein